MKAIILSSIVISISGCAGVQQAIHGYGSAAISSIRAAEDDHIALWTVTRLRYAAECSGSTSGDHPGSACALPARRNGGESCGVTGRREVKSRQEAACVIPEPPLPIRGGLANALWCCAPRKIRGRYPGRSCPPTGGHPIPAPRGAMLSSLPSRSEVCGGWLLRCCSS